MLLTIRDGMLFIGGGPLLTDVNLSLNPGDRLGIVGRNGSGKSHLMKLLSGALELDGGERVVSPRTTVLLVEQHLPDDEQSPLDYIRGEDPELHALERELEDADASEVEKITNRMSELEEERYEKTAPNVLMGLLGLSKDELDAPMRNLSGGLRMRIGLAMALIRMPEVLLLDEPTNHLDLEATHWLTDFLKTYPRSSAVVVVTHDEKLLREVCTTTGEVRFATLTEFAGDYDAFRKEAAIQRRRDAERNEALEKQIKRFKEIYHRFRALPESRAAQAVAQLRKAEKLEKEIVAIPPEEPVISLSFGEPDALPDPIVRLDKVSIGYSGKVVLTDLDLSIQHGARIGLLGRNGQGKSTLIKLLADKLAPLSGDVSRCPRLKIGYFSQQMTDELDETLTVYSQFSTRTGLDKEADIRAALEHYGFPYAKTATLIKELSGGEKTRLLFALISSAKPNLIILDEPTNHLDLETREVLVDALNEFTGSVILVSHDADLHMRTMRQFWVADHSRVAEYTRGLPAYQRELMGLSHVPEMDASLKHSARRPKIDPGAAGGGGGRARSGKSRKATADVTDRPPAAKASAGGVFKAPKLGSTSEKKQKAHRPGSKH